MFYKFDNLKLAEKRANQLRKLHPEFIVNIVKRDSSYVVHGMPPAGNNSITTSEFCFPLKNRPSQSYCSDGREFGANRDNGLRKHAGCDLIAAAGTPIFAMADGVVISNPREFYDGTYVLEIKHTNGMVVRYCEISPTYPPEIKQGIHILRGQKIAYVGKLPSGKSMLHLEMYTGIMNGDFRKENSPYKRREDLTNPTPYLDGACIFKFH